jgi:hypothetical protein
VVQWSKVWSGWSLSRIGQREPCHKMFIHQSCPSWSPRWPQMTESKEAWCKRGLRKESVLLANNFLSICYTKDGACYRHGQGSWIQQKGPLAGQKMGQKMVSTVTIWPQGFIICGAKTQDLVPGRSVCHPTSTPYYFSDL